MKSSKKLLIDHTLELITANEKLASQYQELLLVHEKDMKLNQSLTIMNERLEELVAKKTDDALSDNKKMTEQYEELKQTERKLRRNAEIQSVLREIAEATVLSPSMEELYGVVHRAIGRVLPAKLFHINLLDEDAGEVVVPFRSDFVNFIPERRPMDKGMTEYIIRLGRAVHVTPSEMDRLREVGEYTLGEVQNVQVRHYLGAPLINPQGKPFGVMSLILMGETQSFQPEDVEAFSIIASQVSMAIERKRMENELIHQAMIDELSGMFNRRYFLSRADEELRRIPRYGNTCSLLMIDIDHFKMVNDRFGHAVGDAAIKKIAQLCSESLRDTDLLGRIGGEEFAMMLVETGISEAELVADRLRRRIQDSAFGPDQSVPCPLNVSIGVAELQSSEETLTALMIRADGALYRAKNEGRNRVVTA